MEKNIYQTLQDWHELLQAGVITDAEFAAKKKELLGERKHTQEILLQEDIRMLTVEEQVQADAEYEILFNNKSWFQKNKGWLIGLSITFLIGVTIWYLSTEKSNANSKNGIHNQSEISEEKQKALKLKEKEILGELPSVKPEEKKERKLRYLFHTNGGVIGYFDDGRVVPCWQCNLSTGTVQYLYKEADKSKRRYKVLKNGSIMEGGDTQLPDKSDGWALINYKWYEVVSEGDD